MEPNTIPGSRKEIVVGVAYFFGETAVYFINILLQVIKVSTCSAHSRRVGARAGPGCNPDRGDCGLREGDKGALPGVERERGNGAALPGA